MAAPTADFRTAGPGRWPRALSRDADSMATIRTVGRVLLVDDDEPVRAITARMLRGGGYEVLEAGSAPEALRVFQRHRVDVVVTDVVMPEMDGLTLADKLLAEDPGSRVVLITGYPADYFGPRIRNTRFPLLMKPFTGEQLIQSVERALKKPQM